MEKDVQERFERIEAVMDRFAIGMEDLRKDQREFRQAVQNAHLELEAAQLNHAKSHEKLVTVVTDLGERVSDLTILVDQLIKKDLGR